MKTGIYVDDYAAFGHRRLSIIDRAGGQQPMAAANGEVQIIFNGEISLGLVNAEVVGKEIFQLVDGR